MKVGIINVTGYSGVELARLLVRHPKAELVGVTGRSNVGQKLSDVFPHLSDIDIEIQSEITESVDLVFSALPQVASAPACEPYVRSGVKVIDISADFRLRSAEEYKDWYGSEHPAPDLLKNSVYGLTELDRDGITNANLVANPGCYPVGALLGLAPMVRNNLISPKIIIDAKSGVSGSGRTLSLANHFSEVNENVFAYAVDGHRHFPEIAQELERLSPGFKPELTFTPHLIPMTRGILDSVYAEILDGIFTDPGEARIRVREMYHEFYKDEPFVKIVDAPPQTKQTWGSNECLIYPTVDKRTGRLMVFSVLDNLVKGAAGQAVQNMNAMFGIPETEGLNQIAIYP
jgi:N-acetyl-gamma-glutamyl-phosphate reductase